MIDALETRLREDGFSLNDLDVSSAMALHESIDEIDLIGQIRCENFMDCSWEYALQFGELGDPEFTNAQWECLEDAVVILQQMK